MASRLPTCNAILHTLGRASAAGGTDSKARQEARGNAQLRSMGFVKGHGARVLIWGICWHAYHALGMAFGGCCVPHADLTWSKESGHSEARAQWVSEHCQCLGDDATKEVSLAAGEYAHFHWEASGIDGARESYLTLWLMPCKGRPVLLLKPMFVLNGEPMRQLFETVPGNGPRRGYHTDTWPFPDNNTGLQPQPADVILSGQVAAEYDSTKLWGKRTSNIGFETSLTIQVQHTGYLISVVSETDTKFLLYSKLHRPDDPSPQEAMNTGAALARRKSLAAQYDSDTVTLTWNTTGNITDTYQAYMLRYEPGEQAGPILNNRGRCGQIGADLSGYLDSRCIVWTACGVKRFAVEIGPLLSPSLDVSNTLKLRLADHHIKMEADIMHYFNVLRRDAKGNEELYLGAFVQPSSKNVGSDDVDLGFGSEILNSVNYIWMGIGALCVICCTAMVVLAMRLREGLSGQWARSQTYGRKVTQGEIAFPNPSQSTRMRPTTSGAVTASNTAADSKNTDGKDAGIDNININTKSSMGSTPPRKRFGGILGKKMRV